MIEIYIYRSGAEKRNEKGKMYNESVCVRYGLFLLLHVFYSHFRGGVYEITHTLAQIIDALFHTPKLIEIEKFQVRGTFVFPQYPFHCDL